MIKKIELINSNITRNRRFVVSKLYVITSDVRVKKNVKLTIEDGVKILIQNGAKEKLKLRRAAFIFEPGSILNAKKFSVKACDENFREEKKSDNGGLWFIGNSRSGSKDTIKTKVNPKISLSSFNATMIKTHYLGRLDPLRDTLRTPAAKDDIDGLSVLGVGLSEWNVLNVQSFYSADDGIDITNSNIKLDRILVRSPVEDGVNLSSSQLEVRLSLNLDVTKTKSRDRDLFDFETDDGPSFLILYPGCQVKLDGVFGDEVILSSSEMPKPITKNDNERRYKFSRKLKKSTLIYSICQD